MPVAPVEVPLHAATDEHARRARLVICAFRRQADARRLLRETVSSSLVAPAFAHGVSAPGAGYGNDRPNGAG